MDDPTRMDGTERLVRCGSGWRDIGQNGPIGRPVPVPVGRRAVGMSGVGPSWLAANAAAEKTDAEALTEIREVDRPGPITDCFASPALTGGVLEFLGNLDLHEFMGDVGMHS